jgi:hypothetical protein
MVRIRRASVFPSKSSLMTKEYQRKLFEIIDAADKVLPDEPPEEVKRGRKRKVAPPPPQSDEEDEAESDHENSLKLKVLVLKKDDDPEDTDGKRARILRPHSSFLNVYTVLMMKALDGHALSPEEMEKMMHAHYEDLDLYISSIDAHQKEMHRLVAYTEQLQRKADEQTILLHSR